MSGDVWFGEEKANKRISLPVASGGDGGVQSERRL